MIVQQEDKAFPYLEVVKELLLDCAGAQGSADDANVQRDWSSP
jgi:hypothetical protein